MIESVEEFGNIRRRAAQAPIHQKNISSRKNKRQERQ